MTPTASAAGVMNFYGKILLGAEDAVACIAQAGDDVAVLVQLFILCGNINVNIGVCFVQGFQSFRGGNQANELDVLGTALLIWPMASMALPPVASMGSRTKTSRSAISLGSLQ